MIKNELYRDARKNKTLESKEYLAHEFKNIIQAQFHYFLYNVKLGNPLKDCAFSNFNQKQLKIIQKEILNFRKKNLYLFKRDMNSFNIVILHLLINKTKNLTYKPIKL